MQRLRDSRVIMCADLTYESGSLQGGCNLTRVEHLLRGCPPVKALATTNPGGSTLRGSAATRAVDNTRGTDLSNANPVRKP